MKKLFYILSVLILVAMVLPMSAFASDEKGIGKKLEIGDKIKLSQEIEATYISNNDKGEKEFITTIEAPRYLPDLTTEIECQWLTTGKNGYTTNNNLFTAAVQDGTVTVIYSGESMIWEPEVLIDGKAQKVSSPTLLKTDPVNNNYQNNVLTWKYGEITRYLRQIEGCLLEYYILDKAPSGDIEVINHEFPTMGFFYQSEAWAEDAEHNSIPIKATGNRKAITLASLKDAIYPVTIDPSSTFYTSASDGQIRYGQSTGNYWSAADSWSAARLGTLNEDDSRDVYSTNVAGNIWLWAWRWTAGDGSYVAHLAREYFYFDTSAFPDDTVITGATLSLYSYADYQNDCGSSNIQVLSGMPTYPHDPLESSDFPYTNYGGNGGSIAWSSFSTSGYKDITLNATGISWINKTGITKFVVCEKEHDADGSTPSYPSSTARSFIGVYFYEQGAGYRPKLTLTFTADLATVTTNMATAISCDTATLNGSIIDTGGENADYWGFAWGTTSESQPSSATSPTASAYDEHYTSGAGGYGIGSYNHNIDSLTKGETYHFRFAVHNNTGWAWSVAEQTFTCLDDPVIITNAATYKTVSSARLNSYLYYDGGEACEVRFGWGTSDNGTDIDAYDHQSAFAGSYSTGQNPYLDIDSLDTDTTYYFNVEAQNGCSAITGDAMSFQTESVVGSITNLTAIPSYNSIALSWTKGTGSPKTKIRFMQNGCPTDNVTGTEIYGSTAATYTHTGLTSGTDYCYWVSGYDDALGYSASASTIHSTTLAGAASADIFTGVPTQPSGFNQDPDPSAQSKNPMSPYINATADSIGMPQKWFWGFISLVGIGLFTWIAYRVSHSEMAAFIALILGIAIAGIAKLLPVFLAVALGAVALTFVIFKLRSRSG